MSSTLETAIDLRPFHVDFPDEAFEDLRRRIAATNWPEQETVADESQGVPLAMVQKLARHWMGIADSPVGLAAWLLDHNDADGQPAAAVAAALDRATSTTGELTRDEVLDNITLYWLTNTGVAASRLYWEYKAASSTRRASRSPRP
jgi:hypothetical protein